jgi:Tn3 transposase DDE domain
LDRYAALLPSGARHSSGEQENLEPSAPPAHSEDLYATPLQARALREIGRIERTLFTLDWIKNPDLRRRAHLGLNKGEARNALARAVYFCRLGEVRDRSFENQFFRASGLNLLVAAIIRFSGMDDDLLRFASQALTAARSPAARRQPFVNRAAIRSRQRPAPVRSSPPTGWNVHLNISRPATGPVAPRKVSCGFQPGLTVMPCKDTNRRNLDRLSRHPEALEGLASKASSACASSSPKTSSCLSASAVHRC